MVPPLCTAHSRQRRRLWCPTTSLLFLLLLLLLVSLCAPIVLAASPSSSASYLGCYSDRADIRQRALPLMQELSPSMTVGSCLEQCAALGFEFAGLEYRQECYCSNKPPHTEKVEEELCTTPCGGGGEGYCGGALTLSVYHQPSVPAPTFDVDRPLVCVVMMLKNEAHTVASTLESVLPAVDCWVVVDTGSTDGTPQLIEEWFAAHPSPLTGQPIPGRLFHEEFVDYGATRNRVLELGKEAFNPVFTLMLSADERVTNPEDLRSFLRDVRYARGAPHGAYPVIMHNGLPFDSLRLARVDSSWRYKARVHEYLAPPEGRPYVGVYRSPTDIHVQFNVTDGPRRHESQYFIRKILEEDLARNPNDTRSIFYLARTNSGLGNATEAVRYYDLLAERSQWDEEIYHARIMAAVESRRVPGSRWRERQSRLLDAYDSNPHNMDALHALAQDHFDSGRTVLAKLFIGAAIRITELPKNLAAIENVLLRPTAYLYRYEAQRLRGFIARDMGEWNECVEAFEKVLAVQTEDSIVKDRIKLCREEAAKILPVEKEKQGKLAAQQQQQQDATEPASSEELLAHAAKLSPDGDEDDVAADDTDADLAPDMSAAGVAHQQSLPTLAAARPPSTPLRRRRGSSHPTRPDATTLTPPSSKLLPLRQHAALRSRSPPSRRGIAADVAAVDTDFAPATDAYGSDASVDGAPLHAAAHAHRAHAAAELTPAGTLHVEVAPTSLLTLVVILALAAAAVRVALNMRAQVRRFKSEE